MNHSQDTIQAIFIKQTETRFDKDQKPFTAYRIDIQAAVRQWHIWKRYSDFTKLHDQLTTTFPGSLPLAHLPHKRIFPHTITSTDKVEDRRQGLQEYLNRIQNGRDDLWRKTEIWIDFLALPNQQKQQAFTVGLWIDEYDDLSRLSKEIRGLIHSRNGQQEVVDAKKCHVKAKKDLMEFSTRLRNLEKSLYEEDETTEGEKTRREDKLNTLKLEGDILIQLVNNITRPQSTIAVVADKLAVDYGDIGFHDTQQYHQVRPTPRNGRRAFGDAYKQQQIKETEATKGLDNQKLVSYQIQLMKDQDVHIEQFSEILSRQKELGYSIHHELETQMDLLDSLDDQVDKTSHKLHFANKKLSKIK